MSGGVDSAVAALRLLEAGHRVEAVFMKNWEEDDHDDHCAAARDLADADSVCERLGIPLRTVNFATEYWDRVFTAFLNAHRHGRTPNPDVLCNNEIKFRAFLEYAMGLGAERIAMGHYVRTARIGQRWRLLRGLDAEKDQSYFLYGLGQRELARSVFPLGELTKSEVRRIARRAGFRNHAKKDSTGICFIGERHFGRFLERFLASEPGEIRTLDGAIVGEHAGLFHYTIGQRRGLGLGGKRGCREQAWYVAGKNTKANVLHVVQGPDHPALMSRIAVLNECRWIDTAPPPLLRCTAKIRYRQRDQPCTVTVEEPSQGRVVFDQAQRAMTPGQSLVFYRDSECLGGGIIEAAATGTFFP